VHSKLTELYCAVEFLSVIQLLKHHTKIVFPALAHRNYRIFITGHGVSLIGSWMFRMAQGYLVYQMTSSAFWVGAIDAISTVPVLMFTLFAGVILDHFPKQYVLCATQLMQFATGLALTILVFSDHVSLSSLAIIGFLSGCAAAVDQPARFSLPIDLVGKKDLHAAYALNVSTVHAARIVGPALGGFVIAGFGVGWVFLFNSLSYLALFIALLYMKFPPFVAHIHKSIIEAIREGLSYAVTHIELRWIFVYMVVLNIFGWSYMTMLPVFASEVFNLGPSGLGFLFSAAGVGTVTGGFIVSARSKHGYNPHKLILFGGLLYSISLFFFSLHSFYTLALLFLFGVGFGQAFQNSTLHTRVQTLTTDRMRGRVSSIQSLVMQGMQPLGSFQVGLVASYLGAPIAVGAGALILFSSALFLYRKFPRDVS